MNNFTVQNNSFTKGIYVLLSTNTNIILKNGRYINNIISNAGMINDAE